MNKTEKCPAWIQICKKEKYKRLKRWGKKTLKCETLVFSIQMNKKENILIDS